MSELLDQVLTVGFLQSAVAFSIPLAFAALGGIISERAGVMNIGLEGMMLSGAFGAVWASDGAGTPWVGLLAGIAFGAILGGVLALLAVYFRADQIISGIGVNLLAFGITGFLSRLVFGLSNVPEPPTFHAVKVPGFADIPVIGPVFFQQTALFYILVVVAPVVGFVLFKTRWGLTMRATGESGIVAATVGVRVAGVRWLAVVIGGGLAGIGGVFISLVQAGSFNEGMTGGRGFIALAAVIFSNWRPGRALAATLLFGAMEALSYRIQIVTDAIPFQFVDMLPYLVTLLVLAGLIGRTRPPGALGVPLDTERRGD